MERIHSELLQQFSKKGYSIKGGMDSVPEGTTPRRAIDARLGSAS
jgi:hypothetical protein